MSIVFAPGFMTDATLWDDCLPGLVAFGPFHHVDMTRDGSIEAIASRALEALPAGFILFGFSFGGYVAREIVRQAPDRVQALVLMGTSARASVKPAAPAPGAAGVKFSGLNRRTIEASLLPDHASECVIERIRSMSVRLGGQVFERQSAMRREGDLDRLTSIRCPTLVISADGDRLRSVEEGRELVDRIPRAEFVVIEGSGHMMPIEVPEKLVATVVEWLRGKGF